MLSCVMFIQDGLLSAGYGDLISRLHSQIPKVTPDGKRLQMIVCSATLHSFDVKKMAVRVTLCPSIIVPIFGCHIADGMSLPIKIIFSIYVPFLRICILFAY